MATRNMRCFLAVLTILCSSQLVLADPRTPPERYISAHGYLMAIAFGVLFPLGAIILRSGRATAHGLWQIMTYCVVLAGFGLGIWIVTTEEQWRYRNGHPIIGTIVVVSLLILPFGGVRAHRLYQQMGPNSTGNVHKWAARILITLGFINGGLGLDFANQERKYIYAYSVIGGVFVLAWWAYAMRAESRPPIMASRRSSKA